MKVRQFKLTHHNRNLEVVRYWRDEGILELDAPYQRGVVWDEERQRNLIKSFIIGVPVPSIIINERPDPDWCYVIIDGKQRCTALLNFFDSKLALPEDWLGAAYYKDLPKKQQLLVGHNTLQTCEGCLQTLAEEEEIYNLINYGGVPHV